MKVTGINGVLTGINGQEATPEEEARWRKERAEALAEKQKTENAALNAWNAQFRKPKSHRKNSK